MKRQYSIMAFLRAICCCLSRSKPSTPEMTESCPARPVPQDSYGTQNRDQIDNANGTNNDDEDGYMPVVPLPRYTPWPMSIREKTLETHMRDPPVSSSSSAPLAGSDSYTYTPSSDEKHNYNYEREDPDSRATADDVSSAFSFQSSYGNTSTATRETPPPPYSVGVSPVHTPRRSISLSVSSGVDQTHPYLQHGQPPMIHITQPRAVFQRPEWMGRSPRCSIEEEVERLRRVSGESR